MTSADGGGNFDIDWGVAGNCAELVEMPRARRSFNNLSRRLVRWPIVELSQVEKEKEKSSRLVDETFVGNDLVPS